jgi:hypothetical protein
MVFDNRVLKKILGLNRDDITESQRILHNENFIICTGF